MKRTKLNKLIMEKGLKEGDLVAFIHPNGWKEKTVLEDSIFAKVFYEAGRLKDKNRTEKWGIDYVSLSGLTYHYFGDEVPFVGIELWVAKTKQEKECVRKIKKDLRKGTYDYIS